jgi:hypothetical protein
VSLWIENAHQSLVRAGREVCGEALRTFQTEGRFYAVLASSSQGGMEGFTQATATAERALGMLRAGDTPDSVAEILAQEWFVAPLAGEEVTFSILQVLGGDQAHLVECEVLPLCLIRGGEVEFLPLSEEVVHGRLVRECRFQLRDGDYMVVVSQGYLRPRGWGWGWSDIAVAVRRWTDTGCDADELTGALVRTYRRLNPEAPRQDVTVVAMHVRPERRATIWTGPPVGLAQDKVALGRLMAERGTRIICGGTTAQIAARLLGAELELESRPEDGADERHLADEGHPWAEVPPVSRLEGVDLVTEGLVTLGKARERMTGARRVCDLPRGRDGATRLARALLAADRVHFIIGLAVNPAVGRAATADAACTVPLRQLVVEELVHDLKARGKLVSVERL